MSTQIKPFLEVRHTTPDLAVSGIRDPRWSRADKVQVDLYWSGREAQKGRRFAVCLLWSTQALHVLFEAEQAEPLVVSDAPDLTKKTMGLWDRDVCEIFVAPDKAEPRKYFEFEVAPTGEWLDVAIDLTGRDRVSDWQYASEMQSFARAELDRTLAAMRIPWKAFGRTPKAGDVWLGNLLRCVGEGPGRGYLAWQPTMTEEPAFHVPEKFGEFRFVQ